MKSSLAATVVAACLFAVSAHAIDSTTRPAKPAPKRGMTQTQVLALYGEPRQRGRIDGAEIWFYRLKFNEVYGRDLVPFEIDSDNVRIGEITFAPDGKVSGYVWNRGGPQRLIW